MLIPAHLMRLAETRPVCLRCRICYRTAHKLSDDVPSFSRYDYIILVMHICAIIPIAAAALQATSW